MKEKIKSEVLFFSGNGNHALGASILRKFSEFVGVECNFQHINFADFSDREPDTRIPYYENIAGKTIVFYQSMYTPELAEESQELIWALKRQYGAAYIIAVFPFLRYRRQDHPEKQYEINRLRMIIDRLAHVGTDEIIVTTPHSDQMAKNCAQYGVKFSAVDPSNFFAETVKTYLPGGTNDGAHVYAPDLGSVPRAVTLANLLNLSVLFNVKRRDLNNETDIIELTPDKINEIVMGLREKYNFSQINHAYPASIKDKIIIMVEDEVASGDTANSTGRLLKRCGATQLFFLATHAVLTPGWRNKLFFQNPFEKIIMTNSINRDYEKRTGGYIYDISLSILLAKAIYQSIENHF